MGDSAFFRNYKSKQTCLGRLRRIAGRRSASGLSVFLPAVCAFAAMPTIVVAQFAVIVSANRANLAGNRRLFNRAITIVGIAIIVVVNIGAVGLSSRHGCSSPANKSQ